MITKKKSTNSKLRDLIIEFYKMDKYRPITDEEREKLEKKNEKRIKKGKKPLEIKSHVLLLKDEPIPLLDIAKKHYNDSPYQFSMDGNYAIPDKLNREKTIEYMLKNVISKCGIDYMFFDAQFHSKAVRPMKDMYHDRHQSSIHRIWQIFNGSMFGLTWIYPMKMKVVFDSLYHVNALYREMALYWGYPNTQNKKSTPRKKYTDFIIDQKTAQLCSERFNTFLEEFHQFFLQEYMFRHYRRLERYPLRYDFIFDMLVRYLIKFVFDADESLFNQFMEDDKHGIPIKYKIGDYDIHMRPASYKVRTDFQYNSINPDRLCNEKQEQYMQLMTQFKLFLRKHCLSHYYNDVVMKTRNEPINRLKCYDLSRDDPEKDTMQDVSMLYGKTQAWLDRYKFIFPVTADWLYTARSGKIVNHGHVDVIF